MRAPFFVTAAAGTSDLLAVELAALGIESREVQGGAACEGEIAAAYRACLESRLGLRVLWQLARFTAADSDALYAGVGGIDWAAHLDAEGTARSG
jgi:23S rRNA (guanine2445-N2)-methyltransferase / 23S rRNA (guanine2069-N7)-methyltransferase